MFRLHDARNFFQPVFINVPQRYLHKFVQFCGRKVGNEGERKKDGSEGETKKDSFD